jgi:hypothetical protein
MKKVELHAFRSALESRQSDIRNGSRNRTALAIETSPDELDRIQYANERDDPGGGVYYRETAARSRPSD